jgi:hypothetical protein
MALFGMLAASMGPANAAQLQLNAGAPYLCAVVQGGNTAPGTPVIAYSCSGGPEDQWNYVAGQLQGIGTANGKATCLDLQAGGTAPGTLVVLNACNGAQTQQWQMLAGQSDGLPASTLINAYSGSGTCMDISGGPPVGGGTQLVVNTCTGVPSQNWIVRGMQLVDANAPYVCANVEGAKTANGTPVLAYSCDDAPNELWNYENGQIYGVGSENGTSKCLTESEAAPGSLVQLSTCNGSGLWNFLSPEFGSPPYPGSVISNTQSALCLDRSGGPSIGGGTQLLANFCLRPTTSQVWIVR